MWIARFKVWHVNSTAKVTKDNDAEWQIYFLNYFYKGKTPHVNRIAFVTGSDAQESVEQFKKERWTDVRSFEGNVLVFQHKVGGAFYSAFADSTAFFLKPILVKKGFEYWEIGSWDKKYINALFNRIKKVGRKTATIELLELTQKPINQFFSLGHTDLTLKQIEALKTACKEGYYNFPRKLTLEEIADKIGEPRTTFQDKIRRAEKAIIPKIIEEISK